APRGGGGGAFSARGPTPPRFVGRRGGADRPPRRLHVVGKAAPGEQPRQQMRLFPPPYGRLVDAGIAVDAAKESSRIIGRLGRAEHEESVRPQRVLERAYDLLLQLAVQVDEQVTAGDEGEPGEGGVLEQVVARRPDAG